MISICEYAGYVVKHQCLLSQRICILTCHDDRYAQIAALTVYHNKAEYASRWGYDLVTLTKADNRYYDSKSHAGGLSWSRLRMAIDLSKTGQYDWIYVVGSDTLITNMAVPLTNMIDEHYHFIICSDMTEWNADSFLLRCSEQGIDFMEAVMSGYSRLKYHPIVEQQSMIEQRSSFPGIWKVLPQRTMNSYNYDLFYPNFQSRKDLNGNDGHWQPGDFLIHWAGHPLETRWSEVVRISPQIVR